MNTNDIMEEKRLIKAHMHQLRQELVKYQKRLDHLVKLLAVSNAQHRGADNKGVNL